MQSEVKAVVNRLPAGQAPQPYARVRPVSPINHPKIRSC